MGEETVGRRLLGDCCFWIKTDHFEMAFLPRCVACQVPTNQIAYTPGHDPQEQPNPRRMRGGDKGKGEEREGREEGGGRFGELTAHSSQRNHELS